MCALDLARSGAEVVAMTEEQTYDGIICKRTDEGMVGHE
jgi:hypothetical protein